LRIGLVFILGHIISRAFFQILARKLGQLYAIFQIINANIIIATSNGDDGGVFSGRKAFFPARMRMWRLRVFARKTRYCVRSVIF